jgi:hypothetical protein
MRENVRERVAAARRWLGRRIIGYLTESLPRYEQRVRNDVDALEAHLRKGDVLLVEGDQRISAIIRYLTQSSWSHAALYIGDELLRRGGDHAERARRQFGARAEHLVVEALPEGVIASPIAKYVDYNVRICRPHGLRDAHVRTIMDEAVATIGWRYDMQNVLDLARYMIPVRLVPDRWRTGALHFGSGQPTEVICSSLLARLFTRVRFPILPMQVTSQSGSQTGSIGFQQPARGSLRQTLARRVFGQPNRQEYTGLFQIRHPTLVTPRDFDLSPYFDVIKFNPLARGDFDYSRMQWLEEDDAVSA